MTKNAKVLTDTAPAAAEGEKTNKSIVPSKYGNKYRNGGSDDLAKFINEQCGDKDGFRYDDFFKLCTDNGIAADEVAKYKELVDSNVHGSQGRARMTLRNRLATIVRKEGQLKALDGNSYPIEVAKPTVSGAAAKAQENSGASSTSEGVQTETSDATEQSGED